MPRKMLRKFASWEEQTADQLLKTLAEQRASLEHNGRKCMAGRWARIRIAQIKRRLLGMCIVFPPGPEPSETVDDLKRTFPELFKMTTPEERPLS